MKIALCSHEIDWESLRADKEALLTLRDDCEKQGDPRTVRLEGLIHLLDYVQDMAAEVIGEEEVFGDLKN